LGTKFPGGRFEYCFARLADENETERLEGRLIKTYFLRFGEPPPLNSSIPDRYNDGVWKELAETMCSVSASLMLPDSPHPVSGRG
jgi:hypothetical protein